VRFSLRRFTLSNAGSICAAKPVEAPPRWHLLRLKLPTQSRHEISHAALHIWRLPFPPTPPPSTTPTHPCRRPPRRPNSRRGEASTAVAFLPVAAFSRLRLCGPASPAAFLRSASRLCSSQLQPFWCSGRERERLPPLPDVHLLCSLALTSDLLLCLVVRRLRSIADPP
jgi:hypothetical protein